MTRPDADYEYDHPYWRECAAETSGDEMSKADYVDLYDMENDR